MTHFITASQIAQRLGVKPAAVRHILSTRDHIRPVDRAGLVRLYDTSAIELVAAELRPEDVHETVTA